MSDLSVKLRQILIPLLVEMLKFDFSPQGGTPWYCVGKLSCSIGKNPFFFWILCLHIFLSI